ncbi:metallophosphoesterase [Sutterella sp.]|uniref:metallophosphoesterase n=1 Tax=Sutterella sp. TaxID=1981025 RepID=UPI003FD7E13A
MRFAVFHLLMAVWVLWRFVAPLRIARGPKIVLAAVVAAAALFSTFTVFFAGGLLSPELPRWALIAGNFGEAVLLFLCVLTALREILILVAVLAGRSGEKLHDAVQKSRRSALLMGAASIGLGACGIAKGIEVPEVRRHTARIKDLPLELEGFEFVQLSDLHASALLTEPYAEALVERVNSLNPQLVLITGDFVDGTVERREKDVAPFAKLRARSGVFGCEGNHEHYGDYERWIAKIESLGIRVLRNEHAVVTVEGRNGRPAQLTLGGVCDPMAERFGRELPDVQKTFAGAPDAGKVPRILLAHQPKLFPRYREKESFALQLSGHTHGGQILGMDRAVAIINGTFVRGFYRRPDGTLMYVHPGSGLWNGFPIRVGVPSEIALIRLARL